LELLEFVESKISASDCELMMQLFVRDFKFKSKNYKNIITGESIERHKIEKTPRRKCLSSKLQNVHVLEIKIILMNRPNDMNLYFLPRTLPFYTQASRVRK
jgi:hypothetical protein